MTITPLKTGVIVVLGVVFCASIVLIIRGEYRHRIATAPITNTQNPDAPKFEKSVNVRRSENSDMDAMPMLADQASGTSATSTPSMNGIVNNESNTSPEHLASENVRYGFNGEFVRKVRDYEIGGVVHEEYEVQVLKGSYVVPHGTAAPLRGTIIATWKVPDRYWHAREIGKEFLFYVSYDAVNGIYIIDAFGPDLWPGAQE